MAPSKTEKIIGSRFVLRRPNGAVIWLLLSGAVMGFSFSLILSYFMTSLMYMIPVFVVLVLSGYLCARLIGRAGGEFSMDAKSFSIILEGLVFGIAFDLFRFRYNWIIDLFKYIALGSFFVLISLSLRRNIEDYSSKSKDDTLHLGIMRPSILFILAGLSFGLAINAIFEYFLTTLFYIPMLILLAAGGLFVIISSKGDFDLLQDESGTWNQIFAGATLGFAYDLVLFRVLLWQDILKLIIACLVFGITALAVRMKESTVLTAGEIQLELEPKKKRMKDTPGRFTSKPHKKKKGSKGTTSATRRSKTSRKKSSSSKKRR